MSLPPFNPHLSSHFFLPLSLRISPMNDRHNLSPREPAFWISRIYPPPHTQYHWLYSLTPRFFYIIIYLMNSAKGRKPRDPNPYPPRLRSVANEWDYWRSRGKWLKRQAKLSLCFPFSTCSCFKFSYPSGHSTSLKKPKCTTLKSILNNTSLEKPIPSFHLPPFPDSSCLPLSRGQDPD